MTYAMMKKTTKLMPLMRHKRSQNAGVVYTLVDDEVDAVMRISSRTESEFGSPAAEFFDNPLIRYCLADHWVKSYDQRQRKSMKAHFGEVPTNSLGINRDYTHKAPWRKCR
jgi:hypothetical protein